MRDVLFSGFEDKKEKTIEQVRIMDNKGLQKIVNLWKLSYWHEIATSRKNGTRDDIFKKIVSPWTATVHTAQWHIGFLDYFSNAQAQVWERG